VPLPGSGVTTAVKRQAGPAGTAPGHTPIQPLLPDKTAVADAADGMLPVLRLVWLHTVASCGVDAAPGGMLLRRNAAGCPRSVGCHMFVIDYCCSMRCKRK